MASNTKKMKKITKNKAKPNAANLKADARRIARNCEILRKMAEQD